jgi:hypothetical protein
VSNIQDAIALVSARSNYQEFARRLDAQARAEKMANHPLTAKVWEARAARARRAAIAELVNPETPHA